MCQLFLGMHARVSSRHGCIVVCCSSREPMQRHSASTDGALVVVRLRQLGFEVRDQRVVFVKVGRAAARDVSQLANADTGAQEKTPERKDTHLNCNPPAPSSSSTRISSFRRRPRKRVMGTSSSSSKQSSSWVLEAGSGCVWRRSQSRGSTAKLFSSLSLLCAAAGDVVEGIFA